VSYTVNLFHCGKLIPGVERAHISDGVLHIWPEGVGVGVSISMDIADWIKIRRDADHVVEKYRTEEK